MRPSPARRCRPVLHPSARIRCRRSTRHGCPWRIVSASARRVPASCRRVVPRAFHRSPGVDGRDRPVHHGRHPRQADPTVRPEPSARRRHLVRTASVLCHACVGGRPHESHLPRCRKGSVHRSIADCDHHGSRGTRSNVSAADRTRPTEFLVRSPRPNHHRTGEPVPAAGLRAASRWIRGPRRRGAPTAAASLRRDQWARHPHRMRGVGPASGQKSAGTSSLAVTSAPMPSFSLIFFSISSRTSVLSSRNLRAFSLPWPS